MTLSRWDIVQLAYPIFASAVEDEDDEETLADIVQAVLEGKGQVWGLPTSALFAQVMITEDGQRFLELGPAAGNLRDILALSPLIDAWARDADCRHIDVIFSRDGWARALEKLGYVSLDDGRMRKVLLWA